MLVVANFALLTLASAALNLPIRKAYANSNDPLARRAVDAAAIGNGIIFVTDIEVGTPPQKQTVLIDTGSSDLWLATPEVCNTDASGNAPDGQRPIRCDRVYDYSKSTTLENTTIPFSIGYADQTGSEGFYVKDTVTIAGATLTGANIAYASQASTPSIMGIGFMKGEACVAWIEDKDTKTAVVDSTGCTPYENLPQQLKTQGIISSTAYSVWLNDLSSQKGSILFGGVDHAKYRGQLVTLPIEQTPYRFTYPPPNGVPTLHYEKFNRVIVTLNEVNIVSESGASEILLSGAVPALLDTGSTECSIPSALADAFATAFNAVSDGDGYYINCGVGDRVFVGLNFRGLEIQIPLSQFLRPYSDFYGNYYVDSQDGTELCRLGGSPSDESSFLILGDNVMSSLYSVIDLERGEVALAPAIFNQYDTDIEEIVDSIPRAVQAPAYSYSYSSHLVINPSPTLQLGVSATTSVYGITGPYSTDNLKNGAAALPAEVTKYVVDSPVLGLTGDINQKDGPNATSSGDDAYSYGITNIIETGVPTGQPEGIYSVLSAGPPSTFGLPSSAGTSNTSSTGSATLGLPSSAGTSNTSSTGSATLGFSSSAGAVNTSSTGSATLGFSSSVGAANTSSTGSATLGFSSSVGAANTSSTGSATLGLSSSASTSNTATTGSITLAIPSDTGTFNYSSVGSTEDFTNGTRTSTDTTTSPIYYSGEAQPTTMTSGTTVFTTYCPEPTTFTWADSTVTVTTATTLTLTSCPLEEPTSALAGSGVEAVVDVTEIATVLTTYCPIPTTITYGRSTYVVTKATTLTLTSCPVEVETRLTSDASTFTVQNFTPQNSSNNSGAPSSFVFPTEVTQNDVPTTVAGNGAVQASLCGAMLLVAALL